MKAMSPCNSLMHRLCCAAITVLTNARNRVRPNTRGDVFGLLAAAGPHCCWSSLLLVLTAAGPRCCWSSLLLVLTVAGPHCCWSSLLLVLIVTDPVQRGAVRDPAVRGQEGARVHCHRQLDRHRLPQEVSAARQQQAIWSEQTLQLETVPFVHYQH